jgi:hypothetical protein
MQFFFSFDSFSDIACLFAWYLSSLFIDWICLYMIESLCMLSAKFSYYILILDSYFFYAMKNCALFKAPLRYIFLLFGF